MDWYIDPSVRIRLWLDLPCLIICSFPDGSSLPAVSSINSFQYMTNCGVLVNFIFYYGTQFFKNAGIQNAFLISIATSVVNVFMTLPGLYGVERYGRRSLLLIGALGMAVCEFIVAIVGVTVATNDIKGQQVLIAFVCIYIVSRVRLYHYIWIQ